MPLNKFFPDFSLEKLNRPEMVIIGVDEVGRGALAGPVVAGAVCLPIQPEFFRARRFRAPFEKIGCSLAENWWLSLGIDDSKRLTAQKREKLAKIIKEKAVWGIGKAGVSDINSMGIVKANEKAMRSAIAQLRLKLRKEKCFVLVDAFQVKHIRGVGLRNQQAIIKGDQKSISIAAASIIAKVHRDQLMAEFDIIYSMYGWKQNKGYGTKSHIEAIEKQGISRLHRKLFVDSLEID